MIIIHKLSPSRINELFTLLHINSIESLDINTASDVFHRTVLYFKKGDISLDELSILGSKFFHAVAKHHPKSDFFQATLSASELNFAVRTPPVYCNLKMYLEDIDNFFEKHKDRVER